MNRRLTGFGRSVAGIEDDKGWIKHSDKVGVMRRREDAGDGAPSSSEGRQPMILARRDLLANRTESWQILSKPPQRVGERFGDIARTENMARPTPGGPTMRDESQLSIVRDLDNLIRLVLGPGDQVD